MRGESTFNERKNRWKYFWISVFIFMLSILASAVSNLVFNGLRFSDADSGVIADLSSAVISSVAAGLVLYQLKNSEQERIRQSDIEEATFILQYNQAFIQDPNMAEVEKLLEDQTYYNKKNEEIITSENRQKFVNYLVYLEGLAPLILRGVLDLEHIDDLMAYRFYLAVNNKELQEKELKKFAEYYRGCFKLYKTWTEYRNSHGLKILLDEYSLDKWEKFNDYAQ